MSIANATETAILKLVFQAVAWANYADNAATSPQTQIGVSLHLSDPGEAGDATTGEATYTSYTRTNVPRGTGTPGWLETTGTITPTAIIAFPNGTGGSGTVQYFATAKSNAAPPTGAQPILWSGTVLPPIITGSGVTPQLTITSTITLD